jgi:putative transposase
MVGPCYSKGPVRRYGLNAVDMATARSGLYAALSKSGQSILDGFWGICRRLGIPVNIQVDNAMSFFGSPTYPRSMGLRIRLCLHYGVEPWFIPLAEPWRNGVIEEFNDQYHQKSLGKVIIATQDDLTTGTIAFEQRHNSSHRYTKRGGKTPLEALAASGIELRFPKQEEAPYHRLKKPVAITSYDSSEVT